jgi:hypothetical protein
MSPKHISDKLIKELNTLIEIAKSKNNQLSYTTVINSLVQHNFNLNFLDEVYNYFSQNDIQIINENVEPEDMDKNNYENIRKSIEPFDQTKINIIEKKLNIDLVNKRLKHDEIDLMPDFQRKAGLWDIEQKSRLIESLMLRIPLPAFYFDGTEDDNWLIIDGLQRLTTFEEFFIDKTLKLENLEFLTDFEGCTYDDLPRTYIRRMEETEVILFIIQPGTPTSVKYNIFKRINTSGLELQEQEIRHALYQGQATQFLKKLSEKESFLEATCDSIRKERMKDRELILRFIAFRERGVEEYQGAIDDYLNETMKLINDYNKDNLQFLEQKFDQAMKLAHEVFEDRAFRKMYSKKGRRNPINRALFETWSVCFSKLSDKEIDKIKNNKEKLVNNFIEKMNNDKKFADTYFNSSKIHAIKARFNEINKLIKGVIK